LKAGSILTVIKIAVEHNLSFIAPITGCRDWTSFIKTTYFDRLCGHQQISTLAFLKVQWTWLLNGIPLRLQIMLHLNIKLFD
jgi:hypothetical protein